MKQCRHLLCAYFCFAPFTSPYGCYKINPELANKPPVIDLFPSIFGPVFGHYQLNSYKVVMYLQRLYRFCNIHTHR